MIIPSDGIVVVWVGLHFCMVNFAPKRAEWY